MVWDAPDRVGALAETALERAVCGIDGSPQAAEAARQASLLLPSGGHVLLVCAIAADAECAAADADLAAARRTVADGVAVGVAIRVGRAAEMLERESRHVRAQMIAVGSHGGGRAQGMLLGSVATRVVHEAPCSVLVARPGGAEFPRQILVGLDGSGAARHALAVSRLLASRTGVPLRVVHVLDGTLPRGAAQAGVDEAVEEVRALWSAADGLCARAAAGDLLVLGSRELRGIRSLGSVSEAVAHAAAASVLVVRRP